MGASSTAARQQPGAVVPSRYERLLRLLDVIRVAAPARSGLEAYRQLAETLNEMEDEWWGPEHWAPPRTFRTALRTERLYPIMPESFFEVPGFPGVTLLLAKRELVFVSRTGAIQVQRKDTADRDGRITPFESRTETIMLDKSDAYGDRVWHVKNRG